MIGLRLLDRYELSAELGRGGMGVVYVAHDPRLHRDVAVKVIRPEQIVPEIEERFEREARLVARMDHPGIVPIYDFGRHDDFLFFVMPRLTGRMLRELIAERALDLDEILRIGVQVAEALDYSAAQGVVHRDVKPGNVMVSREDGRLRARVMDFGLARPQTETSMSGSVTAIGTPLYLSPEQVVGDTLDGRSDLYSLGTVLYECLAGEPPFHGHMYSVVYRIVNEQPQSLRSRGVDVDAELDGIVLSCLAKMPDARPRRGKELAAALRRHLDKMRGTSAAGVLSARPAAGATPQHSMPLVGREAELIELRERLDAALAGDCQLVLIGGEAGIGKTRLLQELENLARVSRLRVLRSRFADRESSLPYQGFCELIQDHFRSHKLASAPGAGEPIEPELLELASDLVAFFPILSEVRQLREISRLAGDGRSSETSGEGRPSFLFELLARALAWIAGARPLVLLLENLHEAEASLEALRYVFYRLGPKPLLIVGTYRQTEVERGHRLSRLLRALRDEPRAGSLVLAPLPAEAFSDLVKLEVGSAELDPGFVEELHETVQGNPYFGVELIRTYIETGSLRRRAHGSWSLSASAATQPLPSTIQQAVEARLERLAPDLRRVLSLASVFGSSFEYRDLEEMLEDSADGGDHGLDLDRALDRLVALGLLEEGRRTRGDWLKFPSGVVREVLYRELSQRRRRSLHRRHARALERRYAGRHERVLPRLVRHFSAGEIAEKTVEYAMKLARHALAAWSPGAVVQAVETALGHVEEVEDPLRLEGELRELLAQAHRAAGDHESALGEAARAAEAFETAALPERTVRMALLAAETAWQTRRVGEVESWVGRGVELARRTGSVDVLERLLTLGATVANLSGRYGDAARYLGMIEEVAGGSGTFRPAAGVVPVGRLKPIPRGGTLVTALRLPVVNLDPGALKTFEEQEIAANVFETLVSCDAEGNLVPWLCLEWQGSTDARSFVFTLRPGVKFADGAPLDARMVKASLERSARSRTYSPPMALAVLEGLSDFLDGASPGIRGIEAAGEGERDRLRFQLREPLPIFPATLTDPKTAIAREAGDGAERLIHGSGPFRIALHRSGIEGPGSVVLERRLRYWRGPSAQLERIEFLTARDTTEIAAELRSGQIDLARDLRPGELEELLRDPRLRAGWHEVTTKNVYFALFNLRGPASRTSADGGVRLRWALFESVRTHELVWRTLGRLAQPAMGMIPPGIFGHNPGRRRTPMPYEEAEELLRGADPPTSIRAAIHPFYQDRFGAFLDALFEAWSRLGVEVSNETPTLKQYISSWSTNEDIDLVIGRWGAEYEDPDSYTYALFHSRYGVLRRYYSSADADLLMEMARQEREPTNRQTLYWNLEALFDEHHALLPFFYDVDYRVASPEVRGLRLESTRPYVNYSEIGKAKPGSAATPVEPAWPRSGGEIRVPIPAAVAALDPLRGELTDTFELTSNVFEPLVRIDEGARAVPCLASFEVFASGRAYRFELLSNVRFHDGRRLMARDVRYTYERALRSGDPRVGPLLLPIRGAAALLRGEASGLSGLRIRSATELVIELERPLGFFPSLLSQACLAIVPEGMEPSGSSWRDGYAGTGPFRVVRFLAGERLELERNPHYRRSDVPRSERLVFHLGVAPNDAVDGLRQGLYSIVSRPCSEAVDALRRDTELARGGHEAPGLSTWFMVFNSHRGPLRDDELRRGLVRSLDARGAVAAALGRHETHAAGLIPPGLLGSLAPPSEDRRDDRTPPGRGSLRHPRIRLSAAIHPTFRACFGALWEELSQRFRAAGFELDASPGESRSPAGSRQRFDLVIEHWSAGYPDADSFAMGLLHSRQGRLGVWLRRPKIDFLCEEARWLEDPASRDARYREIESILEREALVVPLFHEQIHHFLHPRIQGFRTAFAFPSVRYELLTSTP